jgi:hypothetical protein
MLGSRPFIQHAKTPIYVVKTFTNAQHMLYPQTPCTMKAVAPIMMETAVVQ